MIDYLQLRSIYIYTSLGELTTIHVTYIKKRKDCTLYIHYIQQYVLFLLVALRKTLMVMPSLPQWSIEDAVRDQKG